MLVDEAYMYDLILIGLEFFLMSPFFISLLSLIRWGRSGEEMADILTFFLLKILVFIGSVLKGLFFGVNLLDTTWQKVLCSSTLSLFYSNS